jgi:adenosylcobinamide-GDP ribazoletransferase
VFSFLAATQFLTTLPVSPWREVRDEDIARAVRYFPVVGALLGGLLTGLYWLLTLWLPGGMTALILVIALLMLTGALHYDGFLDSCDGLFGTRSAERRLEIMRDSRVGSFAVAGGWALLSLKYAGLSLVPSDLMPHALLLGPLLGRWALVIAVVIFPYGRKSGLGAAYKQYNNRSELILVSVVVLVIAGLVLRGPGLALAGLIFIVAWLIGRWIMRKLPNGLTGDSYGAITEIAEMILWLCIGAGATVIKSWI